MRYRAWRSTPSLSRKLDSHDTWYSSQGERKVASGERSTFEVNRQLTAKSQPLQCQRRNRTRGIFATTYNTNQQRSGSPPRSSCSALNPKKQYCGARSPHHPPPQGRRGTPLAGPPLPGRTRLNTQTLSKGTTIPGADDRRRTCSIPRQREQRTPEARNSSKPIAECRGASQPRLRRAAPWRMRAYLVPRSSVPSSLVAEPGVWSRCSDMSLPPACQAVLVENQRYEPPRGHLRGRFNARSRTATSLSPRQNSQRPFSTELSRSKPKHGESRRRTWRIRIENQPKRVPHAHRLGAMSGTPEHFLKLSSDKESSPYPCMISQLRDLGPMVKKRTREAKPLAGSDEFQLAPLRDSNLRRTV